MLHHRTRAAAGNAAVGPIELVGSTTLVDAAGDFSVDISGLSHETGDIGCLFVASDVDDTAFTVSGWTEISASDPTPGREYSLWVRTMSASDTTVASTNAGTLFKSIIAVVIFRNAALPISGDVTSNYENVAGSSGPNPPAAAGTVNAEDWVVAFGMSSASGDVMSGVPTGYTQIYVKNYTPTTELTSGCGYKTEATTGEDPGVFQGTWISRRNGTQTLVLREG